MRWIVYLLGLSLLVGGLGIIGLSIDLQGIERGTMMVISGTVALTGGVITLALGAVIGKIEAMSAALAPVPAIPALNLPEQLEPEAYVAPAPAAASHDEARPGPSAGSIGGAAGAAALAASAYAYREMQSEPDQSEASPPPARAPGSPSLRPDFAPEIELAPESTQDLAPAVSLKPLELAEERAEAAPESEFDGEAPAVDREALIEAAIRREEAEAGSPADIDAALPEAEAAWDENPTPDHDDALPEAREDQSFETAEQDVADMAPVAAPVAEEPGPAAEEGRAEPSEAPQEVRSDKSLRADATAWLDRALSDDPAPPERAVAPAPPPPSPPKPASTVVSRYTSGGVNYTMYSDGSIDAETPTETLHFASMRELKAFIERRASGGA